MSEPQLSVLSPLDTFWQHTWRVWHSGALLDLTKYSPDLAQQCHAAATAEQFAALRQTLSDPQNQGMAEFLTRHPPRPQEFLLCTLMDKSVVNTCVTNLRCWFKLKAGPQWHEIFLPDVVSYVCKAHWSSFGVILTRKDGASQTYEGIALGLKEEFFLAAIRRSQQPEGWAPPSPEAQAAAAAAAAVAPAPAQSSTGGLGWLIGPIVAGMFYGAYKMLMEWLNVHR